jgi:hypothetical protein
MFKRTLLVGIGLAAIATFAMPAAAQAPYGEEPTTTTTVVITTTTTTTQSTTTTAPTTTTTEETGVLSETQTPQTPPSTEAAVAAQPPARTPLPRTGNDSMELVRIGLALVAAGGLTVFTVRRRQLKAA